MKVIIVQGMTCLGKSVLCKTLEEDLLNCKHFSLDQYKEDMWDKFGFDSAKQREHLSKTAKELFYSDINEAVKKRTYDYILLDYAFTDKYWGELLENLKNWDWTDVRTIYFRPSNLHEHKIRWEERSRDFSIRHAGHGATHYHDGVGSDYTNEYDSKIFIEMQTFGETLNVDIAFYPYSRSISYEEIKEFVRK